MEFMNDEKKDNIKVCICGAGHQGLAMAAHLSLEGVQVSVWNRTYSNVDKIANTKKIYSDGVVKGTAEISKVSSKIAEVIENIVMITTPSTAHKDIARELAPYIMENTIVVINPGRTFGAIEFKQELINAGAKCIPHIAETQTIIYTCRKKNDDSVTIFSLKNNVGIASLKNDDLQLILSKIPKCLSTHFKKEISVLKTSLDNVGMVLHCAPVLLNIGWIESEKTEFKYYYEGISKTIAEFLEKIDRERVMVANALGYDVDTLVEWFHRVYEVQGETIYECISNNEYYREIDAPPTLNSRYIYEDIPNGLVPIENIAKELEINTECISLIIDLANHILNCDFREIGRKIPLETIKEYAG